jgi:hypothetical protein
MPPLAGNEGKVVALVAGAKGEVLATALSEDLAPPGTGKLEPNKLPAPKGADERLGAEAEAGATAVGLLLNCVDWETGAVRNAGIVVPNRLAATAPLAAPGAGGTAGALNRPTPDVSDDTAVPNASAGALEAAGAPGRLATDGGVIVASAGKGDVAGVPAAEGAFRPNGCSDGCLSTGVTPRVGKSPLLPPG